jgi:hypothetical protein
MQTDAQPTSVDGSPPPTFPEEIRILAKPGQAVMFDSYRLCNTSLPTVIEPELTENLQAHRVEKYRSPHVYSGA